MEGTPAEGVGADHRVGPLSERLLWVCVDLALVPIPALDLFLWVLQSVFS